MINDVQLAALANWLGSMTMVLIVVYHLISVNARRTKQPHPASRSSAAGRTAAKDAVAAVGAAQ